MDKFKFTVNVGPLDIQYTLNKHLSQTNEDSVRKLNSKITSVLPP